MPDARILRQHILGGRYDALFSALYGEAAVERQRLRYTELIDEFLQTFGDGEVHLFSAPGRTEIGGNHTDHNHGRVLAASVNLDVIAVACRRPGTRIRIQSQGYPLDTVDCGDIQINPAERNRSASLIRGTAAGLLQRGYAAGGLDACTTSDVLKGSGLSSSAAFEVLVGAMLNTFYNENAVTKVEIAQIAQFAENEYFGTPSGLMDQTASSVGGIISIDFADPRNPLIRPVPFDFSSCGHALCIVDVGGDHADLTHEYAAIPEEMRAVAASLGVAYLRDSSREALLARLPELRQKHGDRAVLRAMHFFADDQRVAEEVESLERQDFEAFKRLVIESGHSSFEYLQNIHTADDPRSQSMSLALCLSELLLKDSGAWRVHGGGFGGTTQNFVPLEKLPAFREQMEAVFGQGSCHVLSIRPFGGICLEELEEWSGVE